MLTSSQEVFLVSEDQQRAALLPLFLSMLSHHPAPLKRCVGHGPTWCWRAEQHRFFDVGTEPSHRQDVQQANGLVLRQAHSDEVGMEAQRVT